MIYILILFSSIGIIILLSLLIKDKENKINIERDYKLIKKALQKHNSINKTCKNINDLKEYFEEDVEINLEKYSLSSDSQWLIVHNISKKILETTLQNISTRNRTEGNKLFLSFFNLNKSTIVPKAVITMKPSNNITTTTSIKWDYKDSEVEGNKIKDVEWKGKRKRYASKGNYKVELRVQDGNDNWSEWVEKEITVTEIEGIKDIACGGKNLFVVYNNGCAKGYGGNKYGQLGTGYNEDVLKLETLIRIENVKQISSGDGHTLILQHDRKVKAIGRNNYGQLGNGELINSTEPIDVWGMENIIKIEAGKDFSAALSSSGEVMMWGNNNNSQLGEYDVFYRPVPKSVNGVSNVKQISLGESHTVALLYDGTVLTWGDNQHGQCGTGFISRKQEPSVLSIAKVSYVCAGKDITIAVLENGKVYGWGKNNEGQLALNEAHDMLIPTEISNIENVERVVTKDSFVVAITKTGRIYTWGKYRKSDEFYYSKPEMVQGIKYAKLISANYTNAYLLTQDDKIVTWSSDINNINELEEDSKENNNETSNS